MPLTPADVHNVVFKKPPIGKRGYDEDDVDAFLDEVARELARLIEENNDLKAQVERGRTGGAVPQAAPPVGADPDVRRMAAENNDLKQQNERLRQEKQQAQQAAQAATQQAQQVAQQGGPAVAPPPPRRGGAPPGAPVDEVHLVHADDHVADARREADKVLSEARTKAEDVTRDARGKAEALERDARQRHQEAMGGLDAKRSALQKHIEELKAFEREYRTRLKAYLESQLRDLDSRGQAVEAEVSRQGASATSLSGAFGGPQSGFPHADVSEPHGR